MSAARTRRSSGVLLGDRSVRRSSKAIEAEALRSAEAPRGFRPRLGDVLVDMLLVLIVGSGILSCLAASAWALVVLYYLKS